MIFRLPTPEFCGPELLAGFLRVNNTGRTLSPTRKVCYCKTRIFVKSYPFDFQHERLRFAKPFSANLARHFPPGISHLCRDFPMPVIPRAIIPRAFSASLTHVKDLARVRAQMFVDVEGH